MANQFIERVDVLPVTESTPVKLPFLPGLDGLRALAVSAVLLYHGGISWMPGGFLGVEVFFVISGYLITAQLLAEWCNRGTIDLGAFWLRRVRRLLPALFALLLATLAFAVIFLPGEVANLRGDVMAAFGYVTNWFLIFSQKSYFETMGRPSLLQHLWSLSVEEQFYLFWPILLTLGISRWRNRMVYAVAAGVAASALLMALLYRPELDPSRLYYGTDTRAGGFLIGAGLAFFWWPWLHSRPAGRAGRLRLNLTGFGGLGLLIFFFAWFTQYEALLYQGGFVLVSLATALTIGVAVHPEASFFAGFLSRQPLRWIGLRSYSIYLWHWPVFMVTRPQLDLALDGLPLLALRLGLTGALAELSYRYVETPVRRGALGRIFRSLADGNSKTLRARWAVGAISIAVVSLGLGLAVTSAKPPAVPTYLSDEIAQASSLPSGGDSLTTGTPGNNPDGPVLTVPTGQTGKSSSLPETPGPAASPSPESATPTNIPSTPTLIPFSPVSLAVESPVQLSPSSPPSPSPKPLATGHILALGDSVMLSAFTELKKNFGDIAVDTEIGRHFPALPELIKSYRAANKIGNTVIIHLGNNGGFNDQQFDQALGLLKDIPRVIIVNLKVPREWESTNNAILARGVKRFPNTVLVDWHAAISSHPEMLRVDGLHPHPDGIKLYISLLNKALNGG